MFYYLCQQYGNLRDNFGYTVNEQLMEVSSSCDFVGRFTNDIVDIKSGETANTEFKNICWLYSNEVGTERPPPLPLNKYSAKIQSLRVNCQWGKRSGGFGKIIHREFSFLLGLIHYPLLTYLPNSAKKFANFFLTFPYILEFDKV